MVGTSINLRVSLNSNLTDLVAHHSAVSDSMTVLEVYDVFQKVPHEFLAVTREGKLAGLVSRGQIGFLLGARFGVAVYGRHSIKQHLLKHHLAFRMDSHMLTVFETALCRPEDCFHDDVVLVDDDGAACRLALEMSDIQQRVPGRRQKRACWPRCATLATARS